MIKVAVIGGLFHSGGKKSLVMEYYRHIDRTKVQMDIICNDDSNSIPYDEWKELGGNVYVIPSNRKMWSHLRCMYKILKNGNYDIVHGYDNTLNVFAMVVAKLAGIKVRINESLSMAHKGELKTFAKLQNQTLTDKNKDKFYGMIIQQRANQINLDYMDRLKKFYLVDIKI